MQRLQPLFAQRLHITQGPGNDPVAQRHDQPALLGQRYELAGREQAALAVTPAHQRFQPDNLAGAQIQTRLVMQFQLVTAQGSAQLAFKVGQAAGITVDAFIEHMKSATLGAFGLLHGDVCVPHQWICPGIGAGMGDAQAAADQQAFAVNPVRLGHYLGDAFGHPFGPLGGTMGVDQQGELIASQPRQLVAGFELALEPCYHLQDQPVASLMPQRIVGVTKVVQVQMAQGNAAPVTFGQSHGQQGLKTLAVGDTGQWIFFGQALQRVLQQATFAHMTQAAAQNIRCQAGAYKPVTDSLGHRRRLGIKQQNRGQAAATR